MTTCWACGAPCEITILDRRPEPTKSECPTCRAENNRFCRAIYPALLDKAAEIRLAQEETEKPA